MALKPLAELPAFRQAAFYVPLFVARREPATVVAPLSLLCDMIGESWVAGSSVMPASTVVPGAVVERRAALHVATLFESAPSTGVLAQENLDENGAATPTPSASRWSPKEFA